MSSISCRGLTKSYGGVRVLDGLDLEVPDGAVVTVLGESGSGKTTLLRLIAGFERPEQGSIAADGTVVDSSSSFVPPERRHIGYVAQEGNLFPHLSVTKNIAFGLSRAERKGGRVDELLELVGLAGFGRRYPHELSGGQQQRVALARALAPNPAVVLLDEPFSSLDATLRSSLRADVMRILRGRRTTTVFVTHDQSEALSIADFVGIVDGGRIRQFATPEALYTRPDDPAIGRFLGEANILGGTASGGVVDTPLGPLRLADRSRSLAGPVVALVRPEQLVLRPAAGHAAEGHDGAAVGRVAHREYYGHDCVVLVEVPGWEDLVRVRCSGLSPVAVGDEAAVSATGEVVAWAADDAASPPPHTGIPG